jgi:hypothetical protein
MGHPIPTGVQQFERAQCMKACRHKHADKLVRQRLQARERTISPHLPPPTTLSITSVAFDRCDAVIVAEELCTQPQYTHNMQVLCHKHP